ncbi:MAG: tetratricopeptide repeat protein [Terracidiphilus sp.]|jgi:tetratricopeptide (TPR) repeat protein
MKRTISLWLGLLAFAFTTALAQTTTSAPTTPSAPAIKGPTGSIHGRVNGPEGAVKTSGSVSLSSDDGRTNKFTFPVSSTGEYQGVASPGTYKAIYRAPETPPDKMVDSFDNVKIVAGQDILQDFDMTRKAFIDTLSVEQRKQLDEFKKKNAEILKSNEVIRGLQTDLNTGTQDLKDADNAHAIAIQALGATASKADIEAKETEIKTAKYTEVETLMLRDTKVKTDASALWAQLGQAELLLKKYDEAEAAFKKALEVEAASKKPVPVNQGAANAGLGEIYARTGKIPEANAAYDAAAKVNPPQAGFYYKNEAVIFYQVGNADAQVAAADQAIKANEANKVDPATQAILYYLKGQGLVGKSAIDPKTNQIILTPDCVQAYQKYLQLAPSGQFALEVKNILAQAANSGSKPPKGR